MRGGFFIEAYMTLTNKEREALFTVQKDVALLVDWKPRQEETHEKLKVRVEGLEGSIKNGLSTKVTALHDWMLSQQEEQKQQKLAAVKIDGEMKILGVKINGETRIALIVGSMAILSNIVIEIFKR